MSTDVPGLPGAEWTHGEGHLRVEGADVILVADAGVDWTNDAAGATPYQTSTSLSVVPPHPFQFSALVSVDGPRTTFDAAALTLWSDADHWAKLCFECSPQGEEMVVSVVTDTYSDDANGPIITAGEVWLRVASIGEAYAYHYSLDGETWHFVRQFRLDAPNRLRVGIMSQAPTGETAVARFSRIRLVAEQLSDVRDGS